MRMRHQRRQRMDSYLDQAEEALPSRRGAEDSGIHLRPDAPVRAVHEPRPQGLPGLTWHPRWRVSASPFPVLIFVRDTGAIVAANDAAVRAYGWTHEELRASSIAALVPPTDRFVDRLLRHDHPQTPWSEPLVHHRKDGTTFWAELVMLETGVTKSETMAVVVKVRE